MSVQNFTLERDGDKYVATIFMDGWWYEARLELEFGRRFLEPGCTCRMIPVLEADRIIVGGADDCPVHGFGE